MFSCEICKIFKNSFFTEHLGKLVQQMQHCKIAALNTTTNSNIFSAFFISLAGNMNFAFNKWSFIYNYQLPGEKVLPKKTSL